MGRDEYRASVWATDFYIPDMDLVKTVMNGYRTISQLAEYLHVAEWFMFRKIFIVKMRLRTLGVKLKFRDLLRPEIYDKLHEDFQNEGLELRRPV